MPASIWKGYLSFGLVSFPIRLFAAARPETIHFHMLHKKDLSRIKEVWFCAEEDKPVERADIVKGYETSKGEYVIVEDAELKSIAPPTAQVMEILQFVKTEEVDPIYLEKSYYVAPEEAVSKPYSLLLQAMMETKYEAVAKVAMHGREHIVSIRPTEDGMVLHTMYFADELHKQNAAGHGEKKKFEPKEMELAKKLIDTLASPFKPEKYEDEYRKNVEHLIDQKSKGQKVTAVKPAKVAPVVDILEALQKSLAQTASKPAKAKKTAKKKAGKAA
jgi:DNA end-binding protein Ku